MERIWAAWRMSYVAGASKPSPGGSKGRGRKSAKPKSPCLFCAFGRKRPAPGNLLLAESPLSLVMLNLYPYNVGHVMVAPRRHIAALSAITAEEAVDLTSWLGRMERALRREYRPQGLNLGVNVGRPAGAGVLGHLHWHVVPRWNGDTNFMPVTGGAKVIPESLDRTYRRLWRALAAPSSRRGR
jgi:ATP adenylyltransferase